MKNLIITLFIFSLCSCGKSVIGDYSTTIPFAGKGKDGYPIISLNSDNTHRGNSSRSLPKVTGADFCWSNLHQIWFPKGDPFRIDYPSEFHQII